MALHSVNELLAHQHGVATGRQLTAWGMSRGQIRALVTARRWQALNEHVIVTHNGPLTWRQTLWAADLSAPGLHAMCGLTAFQLWRVVGFETTVVHVMVPRGGHVLPLHGIRLVVHESRRFTAADVVSGPGPQLTRLSRAAVDAAAWSRDLWTAYRIFVAPVQQRKALATELRDELMRAGMVRHRRQLVPFANDLCAGAEALSEVEFLRFCRRHRLPRPSCQRRMDSNGRWRYLDATFKRSDGSLLRVEIDGGVHLSLAVRSRDTLKDNEAGLSGRLVLRYASAAIYADDAQAVDQIRRGLKDVSGDGRRDDHSG